MAIRNRRGLKEAFIPSRLLPGEFAVATDTGNAWYCYAAGQVNLIATAKDINTIKAEAESYQEAQQIILDRIEQSIVATNADLGNVKEEVLSQINQELDALDGRVRTNTTDITELKNGAGKYPIASEAEALAGTANDKLMSPLRTKQYVVEKMKDAVTYPIATELEAIAGISDQVLMTPLKVARYCEENGTGGGGGGGSTIPIMNSSFEGGSFAAGTEVEIRYRWSSPNEGYGILHVLLNNVEIITEEVQQGLNRVVIPGQVKGNYTVLMYVTDRGGLTTDRLTFTLKVGGLDITSTFDDSQDFTIKSVIRIPVTIDTISLDPIYINTTIDSSVTRSSGQQGYNIVQLPTLTAGAHKVSIQAESGTYISNILSYNIVIEDADTLTIICDYDVEQVSYRDLVEIPYRVSLKGVDKFSAIYKVDGTAVKTLEIKSGTNIWSTRDLEVGDHVLRIEVATLDGSKTAAVEKSLRVNASSYTPLQPVTDASLLCWFDATGRTNQDTDRDAWTDKSGNDTVANLVDFNWGSNNGWVDNALKCNGGSYVEIDLQALKDNAPYGLTVDVKFRTRDSGDELDCVLDMRGSDSNSKGCAVDTGNMYLNSGTTKVKSTVLEEEISRATFVIDRQNKLAKVYNNAVLTEAFIIQANEDFTNNGKIYLNARLATVSGAWGPAYFGDCEIYSIRVYERALEADEIVQNHIADIPDLVEQEEKYRLNYQNMMPTMYFYGDTSAMTKDNKVPLRIRYISTDSNKYGESFDLPACSVSWQGTSSLQYAVKNYKIRLRDQDGSKVKYSPFPDGILEDTFCLKADYMESSHANNTGMARFINDCLYDEPVPPQETNTNVRTTIDGFPMQLYIAQSNDTTPVYMGVFNFNLDKGCNDSFGFDENTISFEVASNSDTSAGAFKDDSDASMRQDFELRYPDEDDCTIEQVDAAYTKMKRVVTWVKNSTEETFAAEVEQYFNKEYLLKYYLQVHLFGMVDNLGKNMMLTTWDGQIWYPQFYDMDTQLGLDNTGYLEFLSDIDVVAGVYNTSGSKLWTMVATVFAYELAEKYKTMRASRYTLDNILSYWYGDQVAKIGERQYNADMEAKYIQFKSDYLFMLHGRRYEHMKRWITERLLYLDTIYGYEADTRQSITIRANKSGSVYLIIDTYSPQYLRIVWRNGVEQKLKVGRDSNGNMTSTRFSATLATSTDQEIIIYNARQIKRIANIAALNPSVLNMVEATKLVELDCQKATLLADVRLSANNRFLRKLNLTGCTLLGTASGGGNTLDLSSVYNMRELNLSGTALESVIFPTDGSNYTTIILPTTLKSVDVQNMPMLVKLATNSSTGVLSTNNLTLLKIINCPKVNFPTAGNIKAESVWIENSIASFGSPVIGDGTIEVKSVIIKSTIPHIPRITVNGKYASNVPSMEKLEINCNVREVVLTKVGFTGPQILDFSGIANDFSLVIEDFANIEKVILPTSLKGIGILKSASKSLSGNIAFPDNLKQYSVCLTGHEQDEIIDFSSVLITDYLSLDSIDPQKEVLINVDLTQARTGRWLTGAPQETADYLRIESNNVSGNIKYADRFLMPYSSADIRKTVTDERLAQINFDTSASESFLYAFRYMKLITRIPDLDASNVTRFSNMCAGCDELVDISNLNTSNGEDFSYMFAACESLITIPPMDVSKGISFERMFNTCPKLENVSRLNTLAGEKFAYMFYGCSRLTSIGGINFTNMLSTGLGPNSLFYQCSSLENVVFEGAVNKNMASTNYQTYLYNTKLSPESVASLVAALEDYSDSTAVTLRIGSTGYANLTDELKAAAAAKNWTLTS
ncbi:DUF285 domain-containing protein [Ruminococcus sp. OA3]|uniref:DUF285 domain-containing protein n=1 Tax=Ruminococcus sp. OA3 TaxID=2914164 RepID=UPI001F06F35E|nr:DUF285 domain-containing protein [Ruminococcus sp. OA3]MCH1982491.1 DUF285 domain-containing protein [Ruminococcus sp. OA3]